MKMLSFSALLLFSRLPILADIASPPPPLHRVGFEVLPKGDLGFWEELLGVAGGLSFTLGIVLTVGLFFVVKLKALRQKRTKVIELASAVFLLSLGATLAVMFSHPAGEWKFPSQVTPLEDRKFSKKVEEGKAVLQKRFDFEYARMNETNGLGRIGLYTGHFPEYMYNRGRERVRKENAQAVVMRILEQDAALRAYYDGVPIERIANAMECPEPSTDDSSIKNAFRNWAMSQMPRGLNGVERQIVFDWQLSFYEREGRPWRRVFSKVRGEWDPRSSFHHLVEPDDTDVLNKEPDRSCGYEDFREVSTNLSARAYVAEWAIRAKLAQHPFRAFEQKLIDKANTPNSDFGSRGIVGFMFDREGYASGWYDGETRIFPSTKLTFRGDLDCADIGIVADYCRQLRKDNKWYCELDELRFNACSPRTVKTILNKLSGWRIHSQIVVMDGQNLSAELSGIQNLDIGEICKIVLMNVKFDKGSVPFKAPLIRCLYFIDCEVVDLSFVSEFENAYELFFKRCRQVTGHTALANLTKLGRLYLFGCPWEGTDWLSVVQACPQGVTVTYDEKDVPGDKMDAFKRILQSKKATYR